MGGNESGGAGSTGNNNTTSTDFSSNGVFSWIAKGFENVGNFLAAIVKGIVSIVDWLNPLSDNFILKKIIQGLADILSFLNPNSDKFIGKVIVELFKDLFNFLFVPSEERLSAMTSTIQSKFGFIDTIRSTVNALSDLVVDSSASPSMSISLGSTKYTEAFDVKIVDLSWYAPFKQYGDVVVAGFAYAFFAWRLFLNVSGIINGASGAVYTISSVDSKVERGSK